MDDSETRGRKVFSRRQPTAQTSAPSHLATPSINRISRPKRRMSDLMVGVAAGLSAYHKGQLGQKAAVAATTAAATLPRHLRFIDRHDKRKFDVKVPCRLMTILTLVFLVAPGLVFLHKELHMHDGKYITHYKTEHYGNVDSKEVWDTFRSEMEKEEAESNPETNLESMLKPDEDRVDSEAVLGDMTSKNSTAVKLPEANHSATMNNNVRVTSKSQDETGESMDSSTDKTVEGLQSDPKPPASSKLQFHPNSTTIRDGPTGDVENGATKVQVNTTSVNKESSSIR